MVATQASTRLCFFCLYTIFSRSLCARIRAVENIYSSPVSSGKEQTRMRDRTLDKTCPTVDHWPTDMEESFMKQVVVELVKTMKR